MEFVGDFVADLGRECVDIVHRHGKLAYVFFDDSWIGVEPYSPRFQRFGFDGVIKAVFSGYEARLCSGVDVPTHELRLHPYLFPVDLEGKPTFSPGGDPTGDARQYWTTVRRALLRAPVDRIGLGGYLSLVAPFPDFQEYIARVADEHRLIRSLHAAGGPEPAALRVGVLTSWGSLRSWTCSGHFHENPDLIGNHLLESLCGRADLDVLVNAGLAGTAWIASEAWSSPALIEAVCAFVASGGGLVGIGQPSAHPRPISHVHFQLAPVLGVDQDTGDRTRVARRAFQVDTSHELAVPEGVDWPARGGVLLTRPEVAVLGSSGPTPTATATSFAGGRAVYLCDFRHSARSARYLEQVLCWVAGREPEGWRCADPRIDLADYPSSGALLAANGSTEKVETTLRRGDNALPVTLRPGELACVDIPLAAPGGAQL